jgi:hypothetical protein
VLRYLKQARLIQHSSKLFFGTNKSGNLNSIQLVKHLATIKMPRYEYPVVRRDTSIKENFHGAEVIFYFTLSNQFWIVD